jgi:two-component system cell cycle sensor histidine kinase/response regulator CckA
MSAHDPTEDGPSGFGRLGDSTIAHRVHDLKNLLTVMAGCVDSLAGQLSELQALSDLADLQRALSRAFLLATDLLGSDAALSNERSAINVNHAIVDVEGMLRRMLGPAIGFTVNLVAKAPFVLAHPLDIERILFNLILNAREAIGGQGLVTIATTLGPISPASTAPALSKGFMRMTVSDTGHGIAARLHTTVLREPSFSAKPRGRGLGLGSVNEIVEQLGGELHSESEEGSGTRIHIDLPLTAQQFKAVL